MSSNLPLLFVGVTEFFRSCMAEWGVNWRYIYLRSKFMQMVSGAYKRKVGNGRKLETGNGNCKWKWEQENAPITGAMFSSRMSSEYSIRSQISSPSWEGFMQVKKSRYLLTSL